MKLTDFSRHHRGLRSDEHGTITIELLVVLPLFGFLLIGGVAFWDAFRSNSLTSKVAYTISDIMSRHDVVDDADMDNVASLATKMLPPEVTQRVLRITSICFEDDQHRVMWSYVASTADATPPDPMTDETIPLEIMPTMEPQDSVIVTEVKVRWESHFTSIGMDPQEWRSRLVTRPRFVKIISHTGLNAAKICPAAS